MNMGASRVVVVQLQMSVARGVGRGEFVGKH